VRLEGTLDAFGLPDILQLLAFTKKTGALRLSAPPADGIVRVRDGAISGATSDSSRQVLARRVVGAGLVGDEALQHAVRAAAEGRQGVVAALIADGAVEIDAVLPLAAEQATDAVGELLRWTSGEFSFVVDDADLDALPLQLPVDEVVAEGQRRLAVWAELTAVIPSTDVALALTVAPAEEPNCSREEWGLLALVDGSRTVAEIVALLGRSEFAVMRSLAALVSRGLLVVPGAAGPGGGFTELRRRQAMLAGLEAGHVGAADEFHPVPEAREPEPQWTSVPADEFATAAISSPSAPVAQAVPATVSTPVPATVSALTTVGANALAPELVEPEATLLPAPAPTADGMRPSLTLTAGASDAPVTRCLLLHLPSSSN
jgi:hypothetical protein